MILRFLTKEKGQIKICTMSRCILLVAELLWSFMKEKSCDIKKCDLHTLLALKYATACNQCTFNNSCMHLAALHFSTILIHILVKHRMKSNFRVQTHKFKKKPFRYFSCLIRAKFNQVSICCLSGSLFFVEALLAAAYARKQKTETNNYQNKIWL